MSSGISVAPSRPVYDPRPRVAVGSAGHLRERQEMVRQHVPGQEPAEGCGALALVAAMRSDALEGNDEVSEELAPSAVLLVDV